MEKWSSRAWQAAQPVYEQIIRHPFVLGLATGQLPHEKFRYYLRQDTLYLTSYSKVMAHTAQRLHDPQHKAAYERFARTGVAVEQAMHDIFLKGDLPSEKELGDACRHYITLQRSQADQHVALEAVATLPCFWVYQRVGEVILEISAAHRDNPYSQWIDTYADESFRDDTRQAVAICDALAEAATPELKERMTRLFVDCTRAELAMWQEAWEIPHSPQNPHP